MAAPQKPADRQPWVAALRPPATKAVPDEVLLLRSEIRALPLVTLQRAATRVPRFEWSNPISPGERWLAQPSPQALDEAS
jgi:hypothetical protein